MSFNLFLLLPSHVSWFTVRRFSHINRREGGCLALPTYFVARRHDAKTTQRQRKDNDPHNCPMLFQLCDEGLYYLEIETGGVRLEAHLTKGLRFLGERVWLWAALVCTRLI
jgi:hypothetical protein